MFLSQVTPKTREALDMVVIPELSSEILAFHILDPMLIVHSYYPFVHHHNLLERFEQINTPSLEQGLYGACVDGCIKKINYMINRANREQFEISELMWIYCFYEVCDNGSVEALKLIIHKMSKQDIKIDCDILNRGLSYANNNNCHELAEFLISMGAM